MKFKVTRLDRRYGGHQLFKYMVTPEVLNRSFVERQQDFQKIREWAWANYGPGMERDWALSNAHATKTEPIWAWHTEHASKRLYLKGDAELTFFTLKFS